MQEKRTEKNGKESEMRFKGTRPANGRKDGEMELREKTENVVMLVAVALRIVVL